MPKSNHGRRANFKCACCQKWYTEDEAQYGKMKFADQPDLYCKECAGKPGFVQVVLEFELPKKAAHV